MYISVTADGKRSSAASVIYFKVGKSEARVSNYKKQAKAYMRKSSSVQNLY